MYDVSILNGIPFIVQRVERFANKMVFFGNTYAPNVCVPFGPTTPFTTERW